MGVAKAIGLGMLQGLTEFLPVSSSGHLVLAQQLLPGTVPEALAFDVCLHFGTLVAVLWYFRADLLRMLRAVLIGDREDPTLRRWVWLLGLATLPAAVVGLFFAEPIEAAFHSTLAVGVALLATAALLLIGARCLGGRRGAEEFAATDAILVGFFQAMALVPGISRSGSTIVGALVRGIEAETAARFAFLMAVPAIAGAVLQNAGGVGALLRDHGGAVGAGTAAAAITGWLAIDVMMRALRVGRLLPFAVYCGLLGGVTVLSGML